ncbi:hypothetical protein C7K38_07880 [Tetragenococcus osmophilus]|uniref:Cyclic nucleotide-binding domain-containing protein n=1 Tax=Tetragenococcus osmophilus TaxID=526944 RepID=A0AA38CVC6_9ENTE|nr:Crp/Fnr family transcriptional regulator [Tetragenococcus osmophilus]AYW48287.1 hypothetical protein C7K38_07880 [Tetragenococcus osmophilus]GMA54090.1 hypothetical protein GCM10025857_54470 [Alicyclobacillus contaminans]GMA72023.1 hypothetical protein GCM10025885_10720 [Tetragenococcus osmophilus]
MARLIENEIVVDYYKSKLDSRFPKYLQMNLFEYSGNEDIVIEQKSIQSLYYLVAGEVKVYNVLENGEEFVVAINSSPEIFGEIEFFQNVDTLYNIKSLGTSYMLVINFVELNKNADNLQLNHFLTEKLSRKLYVKSNNSIIHLNLSIDGRLANIIYHKTKEENSNIITLNIRETAAIINSSHRHVNRVLQRWDKKQIITRNSGTINVRDLSFFEDFSLDRSYKFQ